MRSLPFLISVVLGLSPALHAAAQQAEPPTPPADSAKPAPADVEAAPATTPEAAPASETAPAPAPALPPLAQPEAPPPSYSMPPDQGAESRYPDYVVGGVISLVAAAGLGVGTGIAAGTGNPKTALGLGALATAAAGVGVPLVMLGAADDDPEDEHLVGAGIVVATPGAIAMGLGGTIWAYREVGDGDHTVTAPVVLLAGGAVALVAGVVTYAFGASHREPAVRASLRVGPGSLGIDGSF